ncbi:MAG: hypothetical protein QOH14_28 [Pseudonocardiales bacterium]|jgi:hypothetical protein|nr:hypothetical protein [Pseudonocardiales bacterium]
MSAPLGSLADVLPSALAVLGMPGETDRLRLRARLGDVRQLAVLLVDGLGYHLLPAAAAAAPTLADVLAGSLGTLDELACHFPSTTPTSLVTLGTGALPGAHGVLGFTVNVPGTDRVLTHITWRDDPDPVRWQPVPTLFRRAVAAGMRVAVVSRPDFAGSGLTEACYGGAPYVGAARSELLAEQLLAQLRAGTQLVYGYHPSLDTASHLHGIDSRKWRRAAASVDRLIARVVDGLPPGAALLVTADHGALDVPVAGRFDIGADARLSSGLRVVAGEPRVRYLHTVPGATADVVAAWRAVLGPAATVVTREEAVGAGWFGEVPAPHLQRIGDVVVVCHGTTVVLATGHEPEAVAKLVAFHGSTTAAETAIPLIGIAAR